MKPLAIVVGLCCLLSTPLISQTETTYSKTPNLPQWAALMYEETPDWDAVLDAFHAYYETHPFVKNGHTQYLKRVLREQETYHYQFVDPSLSADAHLDLEVQERQYLQRYREQDAARSGSWTCIGPIDWDHDAEDRSYAPGAAHVYTIEQCAASTSTVYAGTATAGLWKSTNSGGSWTNITKDLMVNSVYAVEIAPGNCNIVLASMLDGIYRSTNGGTSWSATGDASFQALDLSVYDIKYTPDGSTLFAATDEGLYRSTNDGSSWSQIMAGKIQEIEFHPTTPSTMYVILQTGDLTQFHKSTDGGFTFTQQTTGWPVPGANDENKRAEIAVTPAAPNKVYALLTGVASGGSGLYGIYVSTDAGASWSFNCCGPQPGGSASASNINMMGWSDVGTDNGGQYYYDLGLAVSPTDADRVFVGGVNLWVSSDGGASFTCPAKWSHPYKSNYVHADIHDINYYSTGELWVANDGGIFRSTNDGASFSRKIEGIAGSDFWGFGVGFNDDQVMLGGAYHNGTLLKNGTVYNNDWICTDGGDGVGGAVNPVIENQVYSDYNIKTLPSTRVQSASTRSYAREPSWTYVAGRFSQIEFAADNYHVHYFGSGDGLYKTEDDNRSVSLLYDFGEEVTDVEVAWTNDKVIYVATWPGHWDAKKLYRSTNGGMSFTEITPSSSVFSSRRHIPFDVEVSYEDESTVWLARVGRQSDDLNKVFKSTNGGDSWSNITSATLNGEVPTNIIAQRGASDQLYLGTTRTVYTAANGGSSWQLFASGLPASARSRQLAISYRSGKLINATNRSVWESNLAVSSSTNAQMMVDKYYTGCARDTFFFADQSAVADGASYQWSFPGATYVSSTTTKTPAVVFGNQGSYEVSLTVNGVNQTKNNFVTIGGECSPEDDRGRALQCNSSSQHFQSTNELGVTSNTMTLMAWVKPSQIQETYAGIIINDDAAAGLNFRSDNQLAYHWSGGSTHWAWNSGLYLPTEEWSFVAMVVNGNELTFYLNDQKVTRTFASAVAPVYWSTFRVGSYQGWGSRNFRGMIDEAQIWNRALSQDEIREWRHLTKHQQATPGDPLFDDDLLAYLQFNESSGIAYDRKGTSHGTLRGSADRLASTAPVGSGSSSRKTVTSAGTYNFGGEDVELKFRSGGDYPNGEIVVTHLNNGPTDAPTGAFHDDHYWIINNYGSNTSFNTLEELKFKGLSGITSTMANGPEQFTLYKRSSNADGSNWGNFLDQADAATTAGTITFGTDNGVTSFSQFLIGRDASLLPVEFVDLWAFSYGEDQVELRWETALEESVKHFVVERSPDGIAFTAIGERPATNAAQGSYYHYKDERPYQGENYYRIRAVDIDGTETYSPIRNVRLAGGQPWVKVYPNPVGANGLLHLATNYEGVAVFELYANDGRLLRRTTFESDVNLQLEHLPKGMYTYRFLLGREEQSGQFVKQ